MNLKKILISLKENPSNRHANQILSSLAHNGCFKAIRNYKMGLYASRDMVVDDLLDIASAEEPRKAKKEKTIARTVATYSKTDWINLDTFKPVTVKEVCDIIKNTIMA